MKTAIHQVCSWEGPDWATCPCRADIGTGLPVQVDSGHFQGEAKPGLDTPWANPVFHDLSTWPLNRARCGALPAHPPSQSPHKDLVWRCYCLCLGPKGPAVGHTEDFGPLWQITSRPCMVPTWLWALHVSLVFDVSHVDECCGLSCVPQKDVLKC